MRLKLMLPSQPVLGSRPSENKRIADNSAHGADEAETWIESCSTNTLRSPSFHKGSLGYKKNEAE